MNCLYVTHFSELQNHTIPCDMSFVIIEDIPFTDTYKHYNLILLPKETCIYELFNRLKQLFSNEYQFFEKSYSLYNQLLKSKSLLEVINHAEDLLKNPIIIIDESFKVIEYSKRIPLTDDVWVKNIKNGYCSYEFVATVKKLKTFKEAPISDKPFAVTCHANKINKRVSKLFMENKLRGYIIIPECNYPLLQEDLKLIPILNNIICNFFSRQTQLHHYQELEGKLIIDLLEQKIQSKKELEERLKLTHLSLKKYKFILSVQSDGIKNSHASQTPIHSRLTNLFPNAKQIIFKEQLLVFISFKEIHMLEDNKGELKKILNERNIRGILSDCFTDLSDLNIHYQRNQTGLKLGRLLDRQGSLFTYNDFKFYHLLDDFPDKSRLIDYCHPAVLKLFAHDQQNQTEYYQTLLAYLWNNQNLNVTAEALFIHRNTMKYRLKKIYELIDLNLKEGETVFQIAYSYKILIYLQKSGITVSNHRIC